MVKDIMTTSITMTVVLKDGKIFESRDIPSQPFGEHHRVVSFWDGNDIIVYPMDMVEHVTLHSNV